MNKVTTKVMATYMAPARILLTLLLTLLSVADGSAVADGTAALMAVGQMLAMLQVNSGPRAPEIVMNVKTNPYIYKEIF